MFLSYSGPNQTPLSLLINIGNVGFSACICSIGVSMAEETRHLLQLSLGNATADQELVGNIKPLILVP